jgi:hypothetical protein
MTKDDLERKRTEAYKALECIFISVEPSIAHDLNLKVRIYINAIVEELDDLKRQHKDCLEQKEALRERVETLELGYRGFP